MKNCQGETQRCQALGLHRTEQASSTAHSKWAQAFLPLIPVPTRTYPWSPDPTHTCPCPLSPVPTHTCPWAPEACTQPHVPMLTHPCAHLYLPMPL